MCCYYRLSNSFLIRLFSWVSPWLKLLRISTPQALQGAGLKIYIIYNFLVSQRKKKRKSDTPFFANASSYYDQKTDLSVIIKTRLSSTHSSTNHRGSHALVVNMIEYSFVPEHARSKSGMDGRIMGSLRACNSPHTSQMDA